MWSEKTVLVSIAVGRFGWFDLKLPRFVPVRYAEDR